MSYVIFKKTTSISLLKGSQLYRWLAFTTNNFKNYRMDIVEMNWVLIWNVCLFLRCICQYLSETFVAQISSFVYLVKEGMSFWLFRRLLGIIGPSVFFLKLVMFLGLSIWLCMTKPDFFWKNLTGQKLPQMTHKHGCFPWKSYQVCLEMA